MCLCFADVLRCPTAIQHEIMMKSLFLVRVYILSFENSALSTDLRLVGKLLRGLSFDDFAYVDILLTNLVDWAGGMAVVAFHDLRRD